MKELRTSLKAVLETLQDMEDFIAAARREGYSMDSRFQDRKNPVGVFVKLAKKPPSAEPKDSATPLNRAYCRMCRQIVPVAEANFDDSLEDDQMYLEHSVNPRISINPVNCKNSLTRVPDDIDITL